MSHSYLPSAQMHLKGQVKAVWGAPLVDASECEVRSHGGPKAADLQLFYGKNSGPPLTLVSEVWMLSIP